MLAPKESSIDISIGNHDYIITQSPALLRSDHTQGTTGAALWQSGVRFAKWLHESPTLVESGIIQTDGSVLELGAGVGLVGSMFARLIPSGRVVVSDMDYAVKLLRHNIEANITPASTMRHKSRPKTTLAARIDVAKFDWEKDDARWLLKDLGLQNGVDVIVACDCIYNYALIQPFVESCAAVCEVRRDAERQQPTFCIIVQHLRQPAVFEEWLDLTLQSFNAWRLPSEIVGAELDLENGFVVHLLTLK